MAQLQRMVTWVGIQEIQPAQLNTEFTNIVTTWNNHDAGTATWTSLSVTSLTVGGAVILQPNVAIGVQTPSYGGGSVVVFLSDAATAPTTNPANGGILYSVGGALKWRGSAGTVTPIAPA